jgi:hypothetical protein
VVFCSCAATRSTACVVVVVRVKTQDKRANLEHSEHVAADDLHCVGVGDTAREQFAHQCRVHAHITQRARQYAAHAVKVGAQTNVIDANRLDDVPAQRRR